MIDVITTAGMAFEPEAKPDTRRELLKGIRAVIRKSDATEDEDVDALEALIEMSKE